MSCDVKRHRRRQTAHTLMDRCSSNRSTAPPSPPPSPSPPLLLVLCFLSRCAISCVCALTVFVGNKHEERQDPSTTFLFFVCCFSSFSRSIAFFETVFMSENVSGFLTGLWSGKVKRVLELKFVEEISNFGREVCNFRQRKTKVILQKFGIKVCSGNFKFWSESV